MPSCFAISSRARVFDIGGFSHHGKIHGETHKQLRGGVVKLAEPMLDERFLMLYGDVLTDIDLTAQIAQHDRTGARATLALVPWSV